ncbi:RHS repeat-associated core domain-containing protein [Streptomyces niveus]
MTSATRGGRPQHAPVGRWLTRGALAISLALLPQLVVPAGYDYTASAVAKEFPEPPKPKIDKVLPFTPKQSKTPKDQAAPAAGKTKTRLAKAQWPDPGSTRLTLNGTTTAKKTAGTLPVTLKQLPAKHRTANPPGNITGTVNVRLHDRTAAQRAGINGLLLTLAPDNALKTRDELRLSLDYTSFSDAAGGSFGTRLILVQLPACALTTPHKTACTTTKQLNSINNPVEQTLTADIAPSLLNTDRPTVLAAAAAASGAGGDFSATPLGPSATWEAGGSTGDFNWNYPLRVPPAPAGPAPSLSLSYNSASVDGRTSAENNQTSPVGEGFSSTESYIERKYAQCKDDGQASKSDLCWKYANATLVLNGKASELVNACDDTSACTAAEKSEKTGGTWRLKNDDASKVEHLTGETSNGDNNGEWWKVTTPDGTQYWFGKHRLPGWSDNGTAADDPVTDSTWTAPVFGNNTDEPCHGTNFDASDCNQAWRWNLDYTVDTHGNAMTYWYGTEKNHYAKSGVASPGTEYERGGYLKRIDYGQRSGHLFDQQPAQRITFNYAQRCVVTDGCESLTEDTKKNWPDVPFDQICAEGKACTGLIGPSFFTRYRLADVNTWVWNTKDAKHRPVDSWKLDHSFPDTGDASAPSLWLKSITATGKAGDTSISMPSVTFGSQQMANHVEGGDTLRYIKHRVRTITSETGSVITVNYSDPQCIRGTTMPSAADNNTLRCFPVYYSQSGATPELDWFHKYVVTSVLQSDPSGASDTRETYYSYDGGAGWAYADDDGLTKQKHRTWSQWRGYPKVTTTVGNSTGPRGKTVSLYMRGLDGEKKLDGGTRDVKVTDSTGTAIDDSRQYAGVVRETTSYDGTTEISGTITDPWSHRTARHAYSWGTTEAWTVQSGTVRSRQTTADGVRTVKATTEYDPTYGMPIKVDDEGDVDKTGDETCTTTTYARNTTDWLVDAPSRVQTYATSCKTTPDLAKDTVSDVTTAYDDQPVGTPPTKGNPTAAYRISGYTQGMPDYQKTANSTFDTLGRPLTATDALNRTTTTAYTPSADNYGPLTTTTETNAKGHSTTTETDPAWGSVTKTTDPNGKTTEQAYDALGRLTHVWQANRARTLGDAASIVYGYSVTKDNKAAWVRTGTLKADGKTYNTAYQLYDAQLRPRQTQAPSPSGGRIISETLYDDRGLAYVTNEDVHDNADPSSQLANTFPGSVPASTETAYDGAGRATTSIFKVYDQEKWRTKTSHQGNVTAHTAAAGGIGTLTVTNPQGKTLERREYAGPEPAGDDYTTTKYTYTPRGEIATITGPDGAKWSYAYDLRGRVVEDTDPDTGKTTSTYNDADQLLTTTNSVNGQPRTLIHEYDDLGREVGTWEDSKDNAHQLTKNTYDSPAKGLPTAAIRYVGGTTGKIYANQITSYDALYRPTAAKTVLAATDPLVQAGAPQTFTTATAYNWDGTIQNVSLPAMGGLPAETVSYSYNSLGMTTGVDGATDYVRSIGYTPVGDIQETVLGTSTTAKQLQVVNRYEDGTRRLTNTHTLDQTNTGYTSNSTYTYDASGNVTSLADDTTGDTQCFTYDGHRRLTEAWTPATENCAPPTANQLGGPAPYWHSWTYKIGGLRSTQTTHTTAGDSTTAYHYPNVNDSGTGQPHTLTSTTTGTKTSTYQYDELGNTTQRPGKTTNQTLLYDAEGKLSRTSEDTTTTDYIYDATGELLIRRSTANTVLYLPAGQELHYNATTKKFTGQRYYSAGDGKALRTNTSLSWIVDDHHGTSSMTVDASTQQITRRYTKPFGEARGTPPAAWPDDKGFLGKPADTNTGLTHIGAREYDPSIGRFLSVDPILAPEDHESLNGYAYANNTPVTLADPTGLRPDGACGGSGPCNVGSKKQPKWETWTYDGDGAWSWGWSAQVNTTFSYKGSKYSASGTVSYNQKTGYSIPPLKIGPKPEKKVFHGWAMGTNPNYNPTVTDDWIDRGPLATWQKVVLGALTVVGVAVAAAPVVAVGAPTCLAAVVVCAEITAEIAAGGGGTTGAVSAAGGFSRASKGSGTIFDNISPTQPNYQGTVLPRSFNMSTSSGKTIWVHGNASKHIEEELRKSGFSKSLKTEQLLVSLWRSVDAATVDGIQYGRHVKSNGWELIIVPAKGGGNPVLKHARMLNE